MRSAWPPTTSRTRRIAALHHGSFSARGVCAFTQLPSSYCGRAGHVVDAVQTSSAVIRTDGDVSTVAGDPSSEEVSGVVGSGSSSEGASIRRPSGEAERPCGGSASVAPGLLCAHSNHGETCPPPGAQLPPGTRADSPWHTLLTAPMQGAHLLRGWVCCTS